MEENIIGKRLRKLREQKNVTQTEVAEYLNIERTTYTAYESGKSRPVRCLDKLSLYYNVTVDYLLGLSDFSKEARSELTATEKEIIKYYWELNDAGKEKMLSYIKDILSIPAYREKDIAV